MAFLETGAFVGLIAPGEFTIILGGVVAGQGKIDVVALHRAGVGVRGRRRHDVLLARAAAGPRVPRAHGPRVGITAARLAAGGGFFERHGGKTILIGRFVGLVRRDRPVLGRRVADAVSPILRRTTSSARALWATTFVMLGYVFWQSFDRVAELARKGAIALGLVDRRDRGGDRRRPLPPPVRRAARRSRVASRASTDKPVIGPVLRIVAPVLVPVARRVWRLLQFVWNRVTPGQLGLELTTLLCRRRGRARSCSSGSTWPSTTRA